MKTSKNVKQDKKTANSQFTKKMDKAKAEYEKIFVELAPFIPSSKAKEVTTEGTWQKTASISCY